MALTDTPDTRATIPPVPTRLELGDDWVVPKPVYHTVLAKLSGNAYKGQEAVHDLSVIMEFGGAIKELTDMGVNVVVVGGASNIINGEALEKLGLDRSIADFLGMYATGINGGLLWAVLQKLGVPVVHMSMLPMQQVAEPWIHLKARSHMGKGKVIIASGGTGNPYCTTDSAASLKAMEMGCDIVLYCKNGVDAIYDSDPQTNPDAQRITDMTYMDVITRGLGAMDPGAVNDCMQHKIPIRVIGADDPHNLVRAVLGEEIGTLIH